MISLALPSRSFTYPFRGGRGRTTERVKQCPNSPLLMVDLF